MVVHNKRIVMDMPSHHHWEHAPFTPFVSIQNLIFLLWLSSIFFCSSSLLRLTPNKRLTSWADMSRVHLVGLTDGRLVVRRRVGRISKSPLIKESSRLPGPRKVRTWLATRERQDSAEKKKTVIWIKWLTPAAEAEAVPMGQGSKVTVCACWEYWFGPVDCHYIAVQGDFHWERSDFPVQIKCECVQLWACRAPTMATNGNILAQPTSQPTNDHPTNPSEPYSSIMLAICRPFIHSFSNIRKQKHHFSIVHLVSKGKRRRWRQRRTKGRNN